MAEKKTIYNATLDQNTSFSFQKNPKYFHNFQKSPLESVFFKKGFKRKNLKLIKNN